MADTDCSLFPLGRVVATPGALRALEAAGVRPEDLFARHAVGDWGELTDGDRRENEYALTHDLRLLSSYPFGVGQTAWIITEADRSVSTLLLPDEY